MSARRKEVPADWRITAPGMTAEDLCDHYRVCLPIIQRWRRECPVGRTSRGPDRFPRVVNNRQPSRKASA